MINTKYSSKVKLLDHLMTSSNLTYWCNKKNKWRPYWCTKPILVHIGITKPILNSFCMQTISFVQGGKTRLSCCPVTFDPRLSPVSRFPQLFADGEVSPGATSATQRQKFHTDDVKSVCQKR